MAIPARVGNPPNAGGDAINGSVLAWQADTLAAFNRLYGTLWSRGVLDHSAKEVARLRNARTTNCVFCKNVRFAGAVAEGLDEDRVELIRDDFQNSALSDRDKLILSYTDLFLHNPDAIGEILKSRMKETFTDAQIVELTAALALFAGFSRIAVSLGGMPDDLPRMELPTPE